MIRRSGVRAAAIASAVAAGMALIAPTAAWAVPSTQIVQGEVLTLVSVADWDAASSLRPGQPVRWDVTVSADAPEPGTVRVGVSATGDADLVVDAALCTQAWTAGGCPGGETVVRAAWSIPRDGSEVSLVEMSDDDAAHLRLSIALADAQLGSTLADAQLGSTEVRVHAQGAGESATVGPGGGLATTGPSPVAPWAVGGALLLLAAGWALAAAARARAAAKDGGS
ncbi:hypothetical protein [Microbacterium foliorum]|uniref:hypothetical protein n=1 Tax=Microbacterium foliorum TaxID=104336 RepID=UPI001DEE8FC4|nr:hypothetical protein [Microbacterium foliorum]CAH0149807.1 hypothetical protein SRABI44_00683 [Microbacterium foliorum]CAH0151340.1 hypothetical protein SRABI03_00767 [Microbacterium foliorum]